VNKMDEKTVMWRKERYDEIIGQVVPFLLKECSFKKSNIYQVPVSAQSGININKPIPDGVCDWWKGKCLLDTLDGIKKMKRNNDVPLRIPVDVFDLSGKKTCIGKIEGGYVYNGMPLVLMPDNIEAECVDIKIDEEPAQVATCGENVTLQIKCDDPTDSAHGSFILCGRNNPCPRTKCFEARIQLKELNEHTPVMAVGYGAMLHAHNISIECEISALLHAVHKKTGKFSRKPPPFIKPGAAAIVQISVKSYIPLECYENFKQLGRFTLRDEGKTIAIGMVLEVDPAKFGGFMQKHLDKQKKKKSKT